MKPFILLMMLVLAAPGMASDSGLTGAFDRAERGSYDVDLTRPDSRFSPADRALIEALYALGRIDLPKTEAALKHYESLSDHDVERRRDYYSVSQDLHFFRAEYAQAAADGEAWMALPGASQQENYQSSQQTLGIARMLAHTAPIQVPTGVVPGTLPVLKDKLGLLNVSIDIDGQSQLAVVDTGASLSVVSASTAKKLGLKLLDGVAALGSSVSEEISSRIAVAPHVQVGGTRFESVVFLVLDDAQLTFPVPGGFSIPAILGFPELRRLGRLKFDEKGMHVGAAPAAGRSNLRINGNTIFVETDVAGSCVPLHLDTGATASELTGLYTSAHPDVIKALKSHERHVGGAGGVVTDQVLNWAGAVFKVGSRQVTLPQLDVSQSKQMVHPLRFGVVGRDVLDQGYEIDFIDMRLSIEGVPAAQRNACDAQGAKGLPGARAS